MAYLFTPSARRPRSAWTPIADLDGLTDRAPQEKVFERIRVDGWKIVTEKSSAWVVKLGPQDVAAYLPQCTHLGCAYHYDEGQSQFVCPCHASNFALDGRVLSGPAPRALDRYAVRLEGKQILIGSPGEAASQAPPAKASRRVNTEGAQG